MDSLGIKLLFSTAWHPQTDGASERTNQTVEFALRYYLAFLNKASLWPRTLPFMSTVLTNLTSHGTGLPSTMVIYGSRIKKPFDITADAIIELIDMKPRQALSDPATEQVVEVYSIEPLTSGKYKPAMIETVDAIKFSAIFMKRLYDKQHKPMFFNVADFVSLAFHRGYNMPDFTERNTKIEQQFAGPFKVL